MVISRLILSSFILINCVFLIHNKNTSKLKRINKICFSEKCSICRIDFLPNEKYYYDYWGNNYHTYHEKYLNRCYSCNRFIHPNICSNHPHKTGGYQYKDNRFICNHCIKNGGMVFMDIDGEEILEELLEEAKHLGIDIPNIFSVKIVSEDELNKIRRKELRPGEKNPALTSLEMSKRILSGGGVSLDTKCNIYVLNGLHKPFFKECLAHELMHVWLFVNAQYDPEPPLCEGMCNYFAYQILNKEPRSEYIEFYKHLMNENPDPIYGDGFRKVRKLADKLGGWENLLIFAKYNSKLPKY